MSDLEKFFNGPFKANKNDKSILTVSPETQLRKAIENAGLNPPDKVYLDGKIHRFHSDQKKDKAGWYVAFSGSVPAGKFGCWRSGFEQNWRAEIGRDLTDAERIANSKAYREAVQIRDLELKRKNEITANSVQLIWENAGLASDDHPYLKRKGIKAHGAKVTGDGRLMVPLFNESNTLSTLQYISSEGDKLYHPGGQTKGNFWMIGTSEEKQRIYIAEGFATAATVFEATSSPCIVAYSASNLVPVTETVKIIFPEKEIVIVADNDKSGVGQKYAEQACAKYGVKMVMPPEEGDANDYAQAGHDLVALLEPVKEEWFISSDSLSQKPAPISWLVKKWLQEKSLIMVHGPSGGGKTFVVLDWCLRMTSGHKDWFGNRVKSANVIYLAGEGLYGLRGRIAAWKIHNQVKKTNTWMSKSGCNLNTTEGYQKVATEVRDLNIKPDLIVVDTLHRFLLGDENSAKDAKTMLDACNGLMKEFDCSVLLVHHTGVSEEAQHRARGSSAWRGALDIEISIKPPKNDHESIEIIQRKAKDSELAEPVYVDLQSIEIPGWLDEDGEQVTSAVVVEGTKVERPKKESKFDNFKRTIERAWWDSGSEVIDGKPYITRSGLKTLLEKDGFKERTIKNMIMPSYSDKLIGNLLSARYLENHHFGWLIINEIDVTRLLLAKNMK